METKAGALDRIRKFGGHMSGMVMPNLGAFVGWGLLAALFIPTGWIPNEKLNEMVGPILNYLLPLLIGYTAGYNIHGQRGGGLAGEEGGLDRGGQKSRVRGQKGAEGDSEPVRPGISEL